MPKSKPRAARTPAAATPSAAPPKNKQVVKQKSKPPVAAETTTVDPEDGGDFAEHNVFDKYCWGCPPAAPLWHSLSRSDGGRR
jgi:hypothetical protein